jgi:hypothetical protein
MVAASTDPGWIGAPRERPDRALDGERGELGVEIDGTTMPTGRPDGLSAIGATALARGSPAPLTAAGHRIGPGSAVGHESGLQGIPIGTTVGGEPLGWTSVRRHSAASAPRPVRRSDGLGKSELCAPSHSG